MIITKQNFKTLPGRLFVFIATAVLTLALSPMNAQADDIDDMLAAGSYVEGEVIAAILTDGSQMEAGSDASYEVTELISVDSTAVQQAVGDEDWEEDGEEATEGSAEKSGYSVKVTTSLSDSTVRLTAVMTLRRSRRLSAR